MGEDVESVLEYIRGAYVGASENGHQEDLSFVEIKLRLLLDQYAVVESDYYGIAFSGKGRKGISLTLTLTLTLIITSVVPYIIMSKSLLLSIHPIDKKTKVASTSDYHIIISGNKQPE
ncbi:hypothetical protein L2E82_49172 [Cichorium intybus]|uniref:Uncharacterized protein n=1 Tax=Cichorium intybus TaxID=13427 RepID=A0ACB8YYZ4_CICIN|nr:hypothetical protein L2E82_49172 [Cichorium intybus]